jgi:adenylylsulfate kinase
MLSGRKAIRALFNNNEADFIEIYLKCELAVCEARDPKGLYKKAGKDEILFFTGISDPYEVPESPELIIETNRLTIDESVQKITEYLKIKKII